MKRYQLINSTTGEMISEHLNIAESFWQRAKGLIGRKKLNINEGLYIPGCRSIHMMFMLFSIDVIFIDKQYAITKIISEIKPFCLGFGTLTSNGVIELPVGTIKQHKFSIGDNLIIQISPNNV